MAGPPTQNPPVPDRPGTLSWSGVSDKPSYYRLFAGYVLAQFATGIATVGLALLAFDLAGEESGAVIGTALSLKMLSYVLGAPILTVLTNRLPRKALLVALDLIRAASLILLPFVSSVWQIYALVIVFATASASFGFVYLAVVPYLLGSEKDYARSVARSRIASDVEGPVSPLLAAGLMVFLGASGIFLLAAGAFAASALLVQAAQLPQHLGAPSGGLWRKLTYGPRRFAAIPELRGVIALDVTVALASAMVMVNTVVIVQGLFDLQRDAAAMAFFAFGLGSILGAVLLPLALSLVEERRLMMTGAVIATAGLLIGTVQDGLTGLLALWALLGLGVAWALTPATYLIRRIAAPSDLQALFAAQVTIANACLLLAYPLAGWLGATLGMGATFAILGAMAGSATAVAWHMWRG